MMRTVFAGLAAIALITCAADAEARGYSFSGHQSYHAYTRTMSTHYRGYHTRAAIGVPRDSDGRIRRSVAAKDEFKHEHPCPSTGRPRGACPGYVIDHVIPLKRGGPEAPANMQWQTIEESKAKDRIE